MDTHVQRPWNLCLHTNKHACDNPDGLLILKHDSIWTNYNVHHHSTIAQLIHSSNIHQRSEDRNTDVTKEFSFPACSAKTFQWRDKSLSWGGGNMEGIS